MTARFRLFPVSRLRRFATLSAIGIFLVSLDASGAYGQSMNETTYPFSWSGATTYTIVVAADGSGDTGHYDDIIKRLNDGSLTEYGVEVLVIAASMNSAPMASASTEDSAIPEKCALYGYEFDQATGGASGFNNVVRAAHEHDIRTVLHVDGEDWCGTADAEELNTIRMGSDLDGAVFDSVSKVTASDIALLRSSDDDENRVWIGSVYSDAAEITLFEGISWVDAAANRSWVLPPASDEMTLKNQFKRAVDFAVEHPDLSNIGMMNDSTPLSIADLNTLLLQPGTINIQDGQVSAEPAVMAHWKILGSFRDNHPAIGGGAHEDISNEPYMFYRGLRVGPDIDQVLVVLGASGTVRLKVSLVFEDDTIIRDAYTGKVGLVSYGQLRLTAHENGVMLLEEVK
jgi:hypothetical protein